MHTYGDNKTISPPLSFLPPPQRVEELEVEFRNSEVFHRAEQNTNTPEKMLPGAYEVVGSAEQSFSIERGTHGGRRRNPNTLA